MIFKKPAPPRPPGHKCRFCRSLDTIAVTIGEFTVHACRPHIDDALDLYNEVLNPTRQRLVADMKEVVDRG